MINMFKKKKNISMDLREIKNMCELVPIKCIYHDVIKVSNVPKKNFFQNKNRKFWIQQDVIVNIGVDLTKFCSEVEGNIIHLSKLKAHVIGEPITESEYLKNTPEYIITSSDGIFDKNTCTIEEQTNAIKEAYNKLKEDVNNDEKMLRMAEVRAEKIIENYIKQINIISNVQYEIKWDLEVSNNKKE